MKYIFRNILITIILSYLTNGCTNIHYTTKEQGLTESKNELILSSEARTDKPGEYLKTYLDKESDLKNTLVILDLDDTVITSPEGQWLGRSEMFYDLLNNELKAHPTKSRKEIAETIDPLLIEVYKRVPVILTDKQLPRVIEQYKNRGAIVIGMTARGHSLWDATVEQLNRTGVKFSNISSYKPITIDKNRQIRFQDGIVMVSHGNTKGEALEALVISKNLPYNYDKIIMIDDKQSHLNNVSSIVPRLRGKNVLFIPVLCTYPQSVKQYNSAEAKQQLRTFIFDWQKDKTIADLIIQDKFISSFLKLRTGSYH